MKFKPCAVFYNFLIILFAFNILVTTASIAEINEPYNIDKSVPGLFEQTISGINDYIKTLNYKSFDKKKNADNTRKALINKFNAVNSLYSDSLYAEAANKLTHDIIRKIDGCSQGDQFSDFSKGFDKNDWIVDCTVQREIRSRVWRLLSHLDLLLNPESAEVCTPAESGSDTFRIGTYNAQFLPDLPVPAPYGGCCEDIPDRVQKMADRIIEGNYDVIALNEVFINSVQDEFVTRLRETYPFYVKYAAPHIPGLFGGIGDGGLMLFSRFPFAPLVNPGMAAGAGSDEIIAYADHDGDSVWQRWGNVAITGFYYPNTICTADGCYVKNSACAGDDCLAAKGAGLVRVQNPSSCRFYNIVFTHLQAHNHPAERTIQLYLIENLVLNAVTAPALASEEVIILGDLNVNGDISADPNRNEWEDKFGSASSEFLTRLGFKDTWEFQTHDTAVPMGRRDRGVTRWYGHLERLDYILRNDPLSSPHDTLCNQHMTVAYNLRHGASHADFGMGDDGIDLSDHLGLNAQMSLQAPLCSSKDAYVINASDYDYRVSTAELNGTITYPGNMQWYRVDEGGTYSVTIAEEGFDYRIYQSSNMSVPYQMGGYLGEKTSFQYIVPGEVIPSPTGPIILPDTYHHVEGETYGVVEPPFYIRVFAVSDDGNPDYNRTGSYSLLVHKHTGRTKDDAIILFPNLLGDQNVLSSIDDPSITTEPRWFRLDPDTPDSNRAQTLRFYLETFDGNPYGLNLISGADSDLGGITGFGLLRFDRSDASDNGSTLYLRVTPLEESAMAHYRVGWATDITVLHTWHNYRMRVKSESQTADDCPDIIGEDDDNVVLVMDVLSTIAGSGGLPDTDIIRSTPINPTILSHEFDSGHVEFIDHIAPSIAYLPDERVSFRIYEDDGDTEHPTPEAVIAHEDTDRLFASIWPWDSHTLPENFSEFDITFSPSKQVVNAHEIGSDGGLCSDGQYKFYYNFSHGMQWMSVE